MAAQKRTSEWVAGSVAIKAETAPDSSAGWSDLPLDFSSKKRLVMETIQDDTASDGGRSSIGSSIGQKSRTDSPPASMLAQHHLMNPLLRQASLGTPLDSFFQLNQKLASYRYNNNAVTDNSSQCKQKNVRPFKAYPRDPLSLPLGFSAFPMNLGMANAMSLESFLPQMFNAGPTEEMMQQYKRKAEAMTTTGNKKQALAVSSSQGKPKQSSRKAQQQHRDVTVENHATTSRVSPPSIVTSSHQKRPEDKISHADSSGITSSPQGSDSKESGSRSPNPSESTDEKKPARSVPDETKDAAYWER
ncbi:hypothetical protein RvY_19529, partial [Ramazzottius varieornatus]